MNQTYRELLEKWMKGAKPYLYNIPERPGLTCYGTGDNGWGVQTNQKAFAAYAVLAGQSKLDTKRAGQSQEAILDTALRLLRFSLQSHHVGSYRCTDGSKWGNTWISALGVERMMHGVEAIEQYLSEADRELLRQVLISESDWVVEHYPVVAGLYANQGNNKPESNLWNGALLLRTALMVPDHPRAHLYREQGYQLLANAISIPSDATNHRLLDGVPISKRFVGANFFESMALNHHGYLNVGYMVICLSNVAMLHFTYRSKGMVAPESLYHHVKELWQVVKSCIFPDGRLLRIGGDTRVRYTYCQEYLVPVWLLVRDLYGIDEANLKMEQGWLEQVRTEMDVNGDGTFLSSRLEVMAEASPLYYTRLESDRAAALSMGLQWTDWLELELEQHQHPHPQLEETDNSVSDNEAIDSLSSWHDPYHGAYLERSPRRIASWVWDAAEKPQGLCLPPNASNMAEWRENLAGHITGLGKVNSQRLVEHDGVHFPGGFITWGNTVQHTEGLLVEGKVEEDIAAHRIFSVALPDDTHMVVLQWTKALDRRIFVQALKGLQLLIPNDVYNGNHRTYYYEEGVYPLHGHGAEQEMIATGSTWLNTDDQLGVLSIYGTDQLYIHRPGQRQIGLKQAMRFDEKEGSLYADEICGPIQLGLQAINANEVLLDTGYIIQSGRTHTYTKRYAAEAAIAELDNLAAEHRVRGVTLIGADGHRYWIIANFDDTAVDIRLSTSEDSISLYDGKRWQADPSGEISFRLEAGKGNVLQSVERVMQWG